MKITQEELDRWKQDTVTQALMDSLRQARLEAMEAWVDERYMGETATDTERKNAAALGGLRVLADILEVWG